MAQIISFYQRKPSDIKPYIDFDKGWKFTEDDKEFLVTYYKETIKALTEECDGAFVDDYQKILDSISKNGVEKSKELIQEDAIIVASAFGYDIYEKYSESPDILKVIENSVLNICW